MQILYIVSYPMAEIMPGLARLSWRLFWPAGLAVSEFLLSEMLWEHSNWLKDDNQACSK